MAFDKTNFAAVGGQSSRGNGLQIWSYKSADALATVKASAYFNSIYTLLDAGDIIFFFDSNTNTVFDLIRIDAISATNVVTVDSTDVNAA